MELPHLGQQCSHGSCNKLDFLPIKCDACNNIYCDQHFTYTTHNCPKAYLKDNQVPECPLCNTPIPVPKGQQPDTVVGAHIDDNCQSDTAKLRRRKIFTHKCSKKGCKVKEVIPVICNECKTNYCLAHRHPSDHDCRRNFINSTKSTSKVSATGGNQNNGLVNNMLGNMSEDEALARAIALSLEESNKSNKALSQEELDLALARQLQLESLPMDQRAQNSSRCNVQ